MRRSLRSILTRVERIGADLTSGGLDQHQLIAILHAGRARNARGERLPEQSPEEQRQRARDLRQRLRAAGLCRY